MWPSTVSSLVALVRRDAGRNLQSEIAAHTARLAE